MHVYLRTERLVLRRFVPEDRSSGEFLAWFHMRPAAGDPPDDPELGYRLRRQAWGA